MIVEFLPQARSELHDAVSYYEGELSGLGLRFWDEIDRDPVIWILAVAHGHTRPEYWIDRPKDIE